MKEIGGYFSLELQCHCNMPNNNGILLNTGRNALEFILREIGNIEKLYIPYFTCDVTLEPIKKVGLQYTFYSINNNLEIADSIELSANEYLLYTNYYGIKDSYIKELSLKYGNRLIVDNAQALYATPTEKCIYSPRKFVGIPDGGIAYIDKDCDLTMIETDESYDRCSHLLIRHDIGATPGYSTFRENSRKLVNNPVKLMSNLTRTLTESIDFNFVQKRRKENFNYLHNILSSSNKLCIDSFGEYNCPMVYPFWTDDGTLKTHLIENKIFVATYWPNIKEWCEATSIEWQLADKVIAIPIDQRYDIEDMKYIIETIKYGK